MIEPWGRARSALTNKRREPLSLVGPFRYAAGPELNDENDSRFIRPVPYGHTVSSARRQCAGANATCRRETASRLRRTPWGRRKARDRGKDASRLAKYCALSRCQRQCAASRQGREARRVYG